MLGGLLVMAGTILKTNDGGASWDSKTSGIKSELTDVSFINANIGWIIGANGIILKTTNGGTTWTPQTSGVSHLSAIAYLLLILITALLLGRRPEWNNSKNHQWRYELD